MLTYRSWTRLLPKSGSRFKDVIEHMDKIKIKDTANQYSELRKIVIESRLASLTSGPRSPSAGYGSHPNTDLARTASPDTPSYDIPPFEGTLFGDDVDFDEFTDLPSDCESQNICGTRMKLIAYSAEPWVSDNGS